MSWSADTVLWVCEVLEMETSAFKERYNECSKFLQRIDNHYKTTRLHKTVETLAPAVILCNDAVKDSDCTASNERRVVE